MAWSHLVTTTATVILGRKVEEVEGEGYVLVSMATQSNGLRSNVPHLQRNVVLASWSSCFSPSKFIPISETTFYILPSPIQEWRVRMSTLFVGLLFHKTSYTSASEILQVSDTGIPPTHVDNYLHSNGLQGAQGN